MIGFWKLILFVGVWMVQVQALPRIFKVVGKNSQNATLVTSDGTVFVPRMPNYIRLNGSQGAPEPHLPVYHSTFSPKHFNATESKLALERMALGGFNSVRVFLDGGSGDRTDGINGNGSTPLSAEYVANLATFIRLAETCGIYVMITMDLPPSNSYFDGIFNKNLPSWASDPENAYFLTDSGHAAGAAYAFQLSSALVAALSGDTSAILAYSLHNEACYYDTSSPWSLTSGTISTPAMRSCDLSSSSSRQECADSNAQLWAATLAAAIEKADPSKPMVTVGMFTFQAVGKSGPNGILPTNSDPRHPLRPRILSNSPALGYVDVHIYPLGTLDQWSVDTDLQSSEIAFWNYTNAVFVNGETGSFKKFFQTPTDSLTTATGLQHRICNVYGFQGYGFWTFDTWEQEGFLWSLVDASSSNIAQPNYDPPFPGVLERALCPKYRPDPCQ